MDNSPIIRFRLDREIAERAQRMAEERGLELPDIMRMMLTKAVRIGDFSIDQEQPLRAAPTESRSVAAYEPRYWSDALAALDAEVALAALHQAIADRTAWLDESLASKHSDLQRVETVRNEREEACELLAAFDPKDAAAVARILDRFSPDSASGPAPEAEE
jgi:antitoxin component of RelBE/YafQ-DinJ toxin-antitoxin module